MQASHSKLVTDRHQTAGFFLHIWSGGLGTVCDVEKHSGCKKVIIKLVLLGNLLKIIDKLESFPYSCHSKIWEENIYKMISTELEEGEGQ